MYQVQVIDVRQPLKDLDDVVFLALNLASKNSPMHQCKARQLTTCYRQSSGQSSPWRPPSYCLPCSSHQGRTRQEGRPPPHRSQARKTREGTCTPAPTVTCLRSHKASAHQVCRPQTPELYQAGYRTFDSLRKRTCPCALRSCVLQVTILPLYSVGSIYDLSLPAD